MGDSKWKMVDEMRKIGNSHFPSYVYRFPQNKGKE